MCAKRKPSSSGNSESVRPNELPYAQREQARADGGPLPGRQELGDRSTVKAPALDGSALKYGSLGGL